MSDEVEQAARQARAEARRAVMTVEVVALGQPKSPPYANSSPEERLAAAARLVQHHQELRGRSAALLRSDWPGEKFFCG